MRRFAVKRPRIGWAKYRLLPQHMGLHNFYIQNCKESVKYVSKQTPVFVFVLSIELQAKIFPF